MCEYVYNVYVYTENEYKYNGFHYICCKNCNYTLSNKIKYFLFQAPR